MGEFDSEVEVARGMRREGIEDPCGVEMEYGCDQILRLKRHVVSLPPRAVSQRNGWLKSLSQRE